MRPIATARRGKPMEFDPLVLSRIQFAFVSAFHIVFPAFTVGLASYIAVLEGLYLARRDERYLRASMFWLRTFAVSFGMGVVSGIIMPFQFGTNWASFSDKVANVVGQLLAYEGLTAFFLEAGFLGVLLFGRDGVPPWAAFPVAFAVLMPALFFPVLLMLLGLVFRGVAFEFRLRATRG
jgi:cytochrome d ubiquinol oxidase subunit I